MKGNEFGNYQGNLIYDSNNGPIAISSQEETGKSSSDYPFEPRNVKMTEYKSGVLQKTEPASSSRYADGVGVSAEQIENVSNVLGRKSSGGEDYSEDYTGNDASEI